MKEYINKFSEENKKEHILFSFSYHDKKYAVLNSESSGLLCVRIGYNPFKGGVFASDGENMTAGDRETEIALELYNMLSESHIEFSGEHIEVQDSKSGFSYMIKTKLSYFCFFYKALAFILYAAIGICTALVLLSRYFDLSGDWAMLISDTVTQKAATGILAVIPCISFLVSMFIHKRKSPDWADMFLYSVCHVAVLVTLLSVMRHVSVLIISTICTLIVVLLSSVSYNTVKRFSKKAIKNARSEIIGWCRCIIIPLGVLACVIAYTNPYFRNNDLSVAEVEKIEADFENTLTQLNEKSWEASDIKTRKKLLQNIIDHEAVINDTFSARLVIGPVNRPYLSSASATFDNSANIIFINDNHITDDGLVDVLCTVLHEYEHVRQADKIRNDDSYEAEIFRNNFNNYISGDFDYYNYSIQPIEIAARAYSTDRLLTFYSGYMNIRNSFFYDHYILGQEEDITAVHTSNGEFRYTLCHQNKKTTEDSSEDFIILNRFIGDSDKIVIPSEIDGVKVTRIAPEILENSMDAYRIESILIPDTITEIGYGAFSKCKNASITVDSDNKDFYMQDDTILIRRADNWILWTDANITGSVNISADCTGITVDAFKYTSGITAINVDENNPVYKSIDGIVYNRDNAVLICPAGKEGIITLPDGTSSIREAAFKGCNNITGIKIPETCTEIMSEAFAGTQITDLYIPETVSTLNAFAFEEMSELKTLHLSANSTIDYSSSYQYFEKDLTFSMCDSLEDIFYSGNKDQWNNLNTFFYALNNSDSVVVVHCSDGDIEEEII